MATIDIRRYRAALLADFTRYAKAQFKKKGIKSVYLGCSQFFADEAGDAVHDSLRSSKSELPIKTIEREWSEEGLDWDSNTNGVYTCAAFCSEQGASPYSSGNRVEFDPEDESTWGEEDSSESPLALAQLVGKDVKVTWLGFLNRPWLDFPQGLENREFGDGFEVEEFIADPAPATVKGDEAKLLAQVHAKPDDLGPRQVLVDLWLQREDPRGEFGALTLAGKHGAAAAKLVLEHGRSWLGPLAPVIPLSGALFNHGPFAEKVFAYFSSAKQFKALGDEPYWATVKSLTLLGEHGGVTTAMKGLREVGPLTSAQLAPLKKGAWKIENLEVVVEKSLAEVAALKLPLKRLSLRAAATVKVSALADAAFFAGLEELEVWLPMSTANHADDMAAAMKQLETLARAGLVLRVGLQSPAGRTGWALERDAKGKKRLMLVKPDERLATGPQLAKELKVTLDEEWTSDDAWLPLALGA